MPHNPQDRYALLQRKVEDLERTHNDGKKIHRAEIERLKQELARSQKLQTEHGERAEKLKAQNTLLETRVQELKKSSAADHAELRELRLKLKALQQPSELKKAREKDRAIAELSSSLALERKKREAVEVDLENLKSSAEAERTSLQAELGTLNSEAATSLDQLEQYRALAGRITEEYAHLAAHSVPRATFNKLKHENGVLQMRNWRLDRRLANSQDQITVLVELVRQKRDENALLSRYLGDLDEECEFYRLSSGRLSEGSISSDPLGDAIGSAIQEDLRANLSAALLQHALTTSLAEAYRLLCEQAILGCALGAVELKEEKLVSSDLRHQVSDLKSAQESIRAEQELAAQQHAQLAIRNAELEQNARLGVERAERAEIASIGGRRTIQQLTETIKMGRMTEEGLRGDIASLTASVAESEQFQAAYYSLSDEVKSLIARKELAEGEAEKLSKFNAEILGHHNPAQKIMYVDRVRRELAETKHRLALTTVDLQSATLKNTQLTDELEMYIAVPLDEKPRTAVTRIVRPPLVSTLNRSTEKFSPVEPGRWTASTTERFKDFAYTI
ncbi:hypothetical protein C8F01DRAFT_1103868 [Mycena amicta]|nr:hypothetical protein C8F01DRAFT_1103868 [Mycena amicta]